MSEDDNRKRVPSGREHDGRTHVSKVLGAMCNAPTTCVDLPDWCHGTNEKKKENTNVIKSWKGVSSATGKAKTEGTKEEWCAQCRSNEW